MEFGKFIGSVKTEWIKDNENMRLLEPFGYCDPNNEEWMAPAGSVVDGASIPQALWTFAGSPFKGPYRNASVVHDVACTTRARTSDATHLMFYFACRCGGVEFIKSKVMYGLILAFGPRWDSITRELTMKPKNLIKSPDEIRRFVEENNPELEEIRRFITTPQMPVL